MALFADDSSGFIEKASVFDMDVDLLDFRECPFLIFNGFFNALPENVLGGGKCDRN